MKTELARLVIHDPVVQIDRLGWDEDGGVRVLAYHLQKQAPEWGQREPPRLPREHIADLSSPIVLLVILALIILGSGVVGYGIATIARGG